MYRREILSLIELAILGLLETFYRPILKLFERLLHELGSHHDRFISDRVLVIIFFYMRPTLVNNCPRINTWINKMNCNADKFRLFIVKGPKICCGTAIIWRKSQMHINYLPLPGGDHLTLQNTCSKYGNAVRPKFAECVDIRIIINFTFWNLNNIKTFGEMHIIPKHSFLFIMCQPKMPPPEFRFFLICSEWRIDNSRLLSKIYYFSFA